MTRFKTLKEFQEFKDTASVCLCGRLMTGFHMSSCRKIRKEKEAVRNREDLL